MTSKQKQGILHVHVYRLDLVKTIILLMLYYRHIKKVNLLHMFMFQPNFNQLNFSLFMIASVYITVIH